MRGSSSIKDTAIFERADESAESLLECETADGTW